MNTPIEALARWRDQTLTRGQMLRELISYEYWWLPQRSNSGVKAFSRFTLAAAELFPSAEGGQSLFLFSDLDIRESFEATHAGSGGMNFLNPMGWEVFSAELGEVQAVVVDPGSPHELVIGPAEFPEWKALADAVDIEQVWKRLQTGSEDEDDMSRAAHYPAYQLVVAKGEQGNFIFCDVANDDGQGYVALFTHADALALGRGEIEENFLLRDPRVALVSGAEIFPTLADEPSAGIVLNFNGPTEPMVFAHGVLDLLCAELASPP